MSKTTQDKLEDLQKRNAAAFDGMGEESKKSNTRRIK